MVDYFDLNKMFSVFEKSERLPKTILFWGCKISCIKFKSNAKLQLLILMAKSHLGNYSWTSGLSVFSQTAANKFEFGFLFSTGLNFFWIKSLKGVVRVINNYLGNFSVLSFLHLNWLIYFILNR